MFPANCEYHRASSIDEALSLLRSHRDRETELLAGGHGLVPDMKRGERSPEVLVDIGRIDGLGSIEAAADGVAVGALARHADLVDAGPLRRRVRVLAEAAEHVGDVQIRNRGTIGGNLADAESGADLPAAVLAADATLDVEGADGSRSIPASEFFVGHEETALAADELLVRVRLPADADGGAYVRKTHPATGYAMVGVAAALTLDGGQVAAARVATTGVTERAIRLGGVEDALVDAPVDAGVAAASERAADDIDDAPLAGDVHASGEYRAGVLPSYVERALTTALSRAAGGAPESSGGAGG